MTPRSAAALLAVLTSLPMTAAATTTIPMSRVPDKGALTRLTHGPVASTPEAPSPTTCEPGPTVDEVLTWTVAQQKAADADMARLFSKEHPTEEDMVELAKAVTERQTAVHLRAVLLEALTEQKDDLPPVDAACASASPVSGLSAVATGSAEDAADPGW